MKVASFDWDDKNVAHISRHGVSPNEAEQVLEQEPLVLKAEQGKYLAYGQTDAGRYLLVVFVWRSQHTIRVISARSLTEGEKKRYRKRRR